ncbi:MAG: recombinase family protein [Mycobacterium sp.]|uniref:recombinase family protein n=1 Tax=Mycobacterium sp. TaxID=1785 RepID=UPI003F96A6EF
MNTAIYVRISEDATGQRAGVERQLKDCRALAKQRGWTVVEVYDDNDTSAFNGKHRPGFEKLLTAIEQGQVNAIICWHIDRLYRRVKDLQRLVDITAKGVQIASVNSGEIDLSTSTGRMLATILGSVAEQESAHKGERRRRANLERAQAGAWRKDQPRVFGYTPEGDVLEPEATAVTQAIQDVLAGASLKSIARRWNEAGLLTPQSGKHGGNRWSNLTVRKCLLKPSYASLRVHQGDIIGRGTWEALIDADTHYGLVALLNDPARVPNSTFERKHMGSTVYVCGICGNKLYALTHWSGKLYYGCKAGNKHLTRQAGPVDEFVTQLVLGVLSREGIEAQLRPDEGIDRAALHARREALTARKVELAGLFAAQTIDAAQLARGTTDLATQIAGVDQVLAQAVSTSPAVALLESSEPLTEAWSELSADLKGKVVTELMTITLLPTAKGQKAVHNGVADPDYIRVEAKV